jgi:chemotaxis response regulator CheB
MANSPGQPGATADAVGDLPFPVVAIGASAGGLEPLTSLLGSIPRDAGLSFVVAMHLDPHARSELPDILAKVTPLPVVEATEGVKVEVNRVYVGPPGASIILVDGSLALLSRPPHGLPIRLWVSGCSTGEEVYSLASASWSSSPTATTPTP